jgi:polyisoprenoid-binding protein YceI
MEEITFTNVKYVAGQSGDQEAISFTVDGVTKSLTATATTTKYMRQVAAGTLTIQDAD